MLHSNNWSLPMKLLLLFSCCWLPAPRRPMTSASTHRTCTARPLLILRLTRDAGIRPAGAGHRHP
jgi:hypothetical protein